MPNHEVMTVDFCVGALAEAFGQTQISEELLNVWEHALGDLSDGQIFQAYTHLIRTRQDRRFPVPADLIAALYGTYEDAAVLGWNTAFKSILSHPGRDLEFEDPIIAETMRELGGVTFLSGLSHRDLLFQRKPFIGTYKILCKNGNQNFNPVCDGQYNTFHSKPILIRRNDPVLLEAPTPEEEAF